MPRGAGLLRRALLHAGRDAEARRFARRLIAALRGRAGVDTIVVNAAGCGSHLKDYGRLLRRRRGAGESARAPSRRKVRDVTELLAALAPPRRAPRRLSGAGRLPRRLSPRRTRRASGAAPRALLRDHPRPELVRDRRRRRNAAAAPASTTWWSRRAPTRSARARLGNVLATGAASWPAPTPAARLHLQRLLEAKGAVSRRPTPWRSSTPRSGPGPPGR